MAPAATSLINKGAVEKYFGQSERKCCIHFSEVPFVYSRLLYMHHDIAAIESVVFSCSI